MSSLTAGDLKDETVDGIRYVWPAGAEEASIGDTVRFLAPFDPLVWDRKRFEHLWGWPYRFEAYTPAPKRTMGYYALPLLWRDDVIGWANLKVAQGKLNVDLGLRERGAQDDDLQAGAGGRGRPLQRLYSASSATADRSRNALQPSRARSRQPRLTESQEALTTTPWGA